MELTDSKNYSTKAVLHKVRTLVHFNAGRDFRITLALPADSLEGDAE